VGAARQLALVAPREARDAGAGVAGGVQVFPEALARQGLRVDLAPAVALPDAVVDLAIGFEAGGRERQALAAKGGRQGPALGPGEVEQRLVEVE